MILLHRLHASHFKQLTDVELRLPDAGTVLIEGHNEAGKSSLFEAVYFALYGQPLLRDQDYRLEHLKQYGADEMRVELDFSIGDKRFSLTRRYGRSHTASLSLDSGEGESETIRTLGEIKKRLQEEMRLSAEALLNTCFVEQKKLEQLESLDANKRRETINELLNLRVLTQLESEFKVTRDDRAALDAKERLVRIAEYDAEWPKLQAKEHAAWRCHWQVRMRDEGAQVAQLQEQIAQWQTQQNKIAVERAAIVRALEECETLTRAMGAINGDLTQRAHRWQDAETVREKANSRVRELESLGATLPERQAQFDEKIEWLEQLRALEETESRIEEQKQEVTAHEKRLAEHDTTQQQAEAGEAQLRPLREQLQSAQDAIEAAVIARRQRQESNTRAGALRDFLRLHEEWQRAKREAGELSQQLVQCEAVASQLPALKARVEALEQCEAQWNRHDTAVHEIERIEVALAATKERASQAQARRERRVRLQSEIARLERELEPAQNQVIARAQAVREAQAREALGDWIEAVERHDSVAGTPLNDWKTRHAQAKKNLDECTVQVQSAKSSITPAYALLAGSVALLAAGFVLPVLWIVAALTVMAGGALLLKNQKTVQLAESDLSTARSALDKLDGEKAALAAQQQTAVASREQWAKRRAQAQEKLEACGFPLPQTLQAARDSLQQWRETPLSQVQTAEQEAAAHLQRLQLELADVKRRFEAEGEPNGGSKDGTGLQAEIENFMAQIEQQREVLAANDPALLLRSLGVEISRDALRDALNAARDNYAKAQAQQSAARGLAQRHGDKEIQAAQLAVECKEAASHLGLEAEGAPVSVVVTAREQLSQWQVVCSDLPDIALEKRETQVREAKGEIERKITALETDLKRLRTTLEDAPREALCTTLKTTRMRLGELEELAMQAATVRQSLQVANLPDDSVALDRTLAVGRHALENDQARFAELPQAQSAARQAGEAAQEQAGQWNEAWQRQLGELAPEIPDSAVEALPRLAQVHEALSLRRQALNEVVLRQRDKELLNEKESLQQSITQHELRENQARQREQDARQKLQELSEAPELEPEIEDATSRSAEEWRFEAEQRAQSVQNNRTARKTLAQQAEVGESLLDLAQAHQDWKEVRLDLEVRKRATEIVSHSRQSLVSRVMPLTTQNMQRFLPVLTQNRYKDVQWDENGNRLAVYDSQARDYVSKRVFSGGARDQISLAMRLSFALATLPGEYNIRPGWLFLDEPLSSFDRARTQSLVDLLTAPRGDIRRNFPQIFLISHSESFDPGCFDHRVRLEHGRIVESTLVESTLAN